MYFWNGVGYLFATGAVVMTAIPFDGPFGEMACGAAAGAAFARGAAMAMPRVIRFIPLR